jgi:3D (Asp-Asp-Asp) domain-containing protein
MTLDLSRWIRLATRVALLLALGGATTVALAAREPARPLVAEPVVVVAPIRVVGSVVTAPRRAATDSVRRPERALTGDEVEVSLTAYCLRGLTRRDNPVRPGIVAADPRVFPLGSYVEVYVGKRHLGRFLVDDTGGVIKGNKLDVWTPECREARRFGRRKGKAILVPADAEEVPVPDVTTLLPR